MCKLYKSTETKRVDWYTRSSTVACQISRPNAVRFFAWQFIKDKVYTQQVNSVEALRNRIVEACNVITAAMLINIMSEIPRRARVCIRNSGRHFI